MLSLAPLLVLAVRGVGALFSDAAARAEVHHYLVTVMGTGAGDAASQMIGPLSRPGSGAMATIISVIVLIVSASQVFGEMQDSLNTIWEVKPKPGRGVIGVIRDRFLSFALVLGACFLLLVSLIISTALSGLAGKLSGNSPSWMWHIGEFLLSLVVTSALFAAMFKYLPDVEVHWHDVWPGAIFTGVLFSIGKLVLGWYLGRAATTSVYAAAGSLISVLLWVFYSAQILFFGAELTQVYAHRTRGAIPPSDNAVNVTEMERSQQGMPDSDRVRALAAKGNGKH